jgi:hypothetical protein
MITRNNFNYLIATPLPVQWGTAGITVAGTTGVNSSGAAYLSYPYDLALDSFDSIYIAERGNNRVQKWLVNATSGSTVAGQANGAAGSALDYFNRTGGVVVDSNENLYVTDPFNNRVQYWANGSSSGTIIAGTGMLSNNIMNPY